MERINSNRHFASGTYKDNTGQYGVTGIPEDFPATSDVLDYISDDLLNYIIDYNDHTLINNNGTTGGYYSPTDGTSNWRLYPYINIDSEEDFQNFYSEIGPENSGNAAGAALSKEQQILLLVISLIAFLIILKARYLSCMKAERDQLRPEGGNNLRINSNVETHCL